MKELQKLRGVGEVLSRRLVESSYDTIAKVAAEYHLEIYPAPGRRHPQDAEPQI